MLKRLRENSEGKPFFYRADVRVVIIIILFVAGFVLRLNYAMNTDIYTRQHDIGRIGSSGHIGYIQYIYENQKLPDFDVRTKWQFYHPPLHHAIAAAWVGVQTHFGAELYDAMMGVRFLTVAYSTLAMFIFYKMLRLLGHDGFSLYIPFALIAFHPTFIILAGSVNNDCLAVTLSFAAIYFAVRWYKKRGWCDIIFLGLSIGLAMFTKLSYWYLAPATAVMFLAVLINEKKKGRIIGQYTAFGAVCLPTGLFWSVRNLIGWGVPLNYVPRLAVDHEQYVGFRSVWERLFDVYHSFAEDVYVCRGTMGNSFFEYNLPAAIIKSSVFGEFRLGTEFEACLLAAANFALIAFTVGCGIWIFVKKIKPTLLRSWFFMLWLTVIVSYVIFAFTYPHDCSMDFRYIVPSLCVGVVAVAEYLRSGKSRGIKAAVAVVSAVFCVVSGVIYFI